MAVPSYDPSIGIQNPGTPQARVEPITPASSTAPIFEAAAGIGKNLEEIGSRLETHAVMQDRLRAQQDEYAAKEGYKTAVQDAIADPDKGLLSKYKGVNAPQALFEFDKMRKGVPAAPGAPGTPSLRDQFMQGKSAFQQKNLERDFDNIDSMFRGKLINHVLQQSEAASRAINEANIDSNLKDGALVTPTKVSDPASGKLIPAITLAENKMRDTITKDVYFQKEGHPPEVINKLVQDHVDQLAKIAVEANVGKDWQSAQKVLEDSTASPEARAGLTKVINGARIDQYTDALTNSVVKDPTLRAPNGQIDEVKAQDFVRKQITQQEGGKNPLPPGHGDAIFGKLQSQITAENKGIQQRGDQLKDEAITGIYKAMQDPAADRNAVRAQFVKQGQFLNGKDREAADDFLDKVAKKDPTAIDDAWASVPQSQRDSLAMKLPEIKAKFPFPDDQQAFENSVKQRVLEGGNRSRDAVESIYQDQFKKAVTGAPRFFGVFGKHPFGDKSEPRFQIDEALQKNQPVLKAIGGLDKAAALAKELGGPDKLAPNTNESKAILVLQKYGKPINASTISTVIEKHADLLK